MLLYVRCKRTNGTSKENHCVRTRALFWPERLVGGGRQHRVYPWNYYVSELYAHHEEGLVMSKSVDQKSIQSLYNHYGYEYAFEPNSVIESTKSNSSKQIK